MTNIDLRERKNKSYAEKLRTTLQMGSKENINVYVRWAYKPHIRSRHLGRPNSWILASGSKGLRDAATYGNG